MNDGNKLTAHSTLVEILEAEICPDHIHMLVAIPSKLSVLSFMGKKMQGERLFPSRLHSARWFRR